MHTELRYEWCHLWNQNKHTEQNIQIDGTTVFDFAVFYVNLFYCMGWAVIRVLYDLSVLHVSRDFVYILH